MQWSWTDTDPMGWLDRLRPLATDDLVDELAETLTADQDAQWLWETQIRPSHEAVRVMIESVQPAGGQAPTGPLRFVVAYRSTHHTNSGWKQPSAVTRVTVVMERTTSGWRATELTKEEGAGLRPRPWSLTSPVEADSRIPVNGAIAL